MEDKIMNDHQKQTVSKKVNILLSIIPNGANPAFSRPSFDEHTHAHTHANSTQQEWVSSAFLKMAAKVKSRQASIAVTCFSEKTIAHDRHLLKDNT